MKFQAKAVKGIGLLVAGMLFHAVPMAAQQEIAPDHFDGPSSASVSHKPAGHHRKSASTQSKSTAVSHVAQATKSKPGSQPSIIVKAEVATAAVDSPSR